MKESITKFDLEAAFKALDELEMPIAEKGIRANKPALTEIFSRKTKLDTLIEEYYDISNMAELDDAKSAREAEVAQAKLARIEKIVDLNAESPEDLLPSYVGKFIMQCPQCMTLFYKDPEDIEASEEDPETVNINEVCQHCGNDSGYTLIGKVGAATEEEQDDALGVQEVDVDSAEDAEMSIGANEDEAATEDNDVDLDLEQAEGAEDFDLDALALDEEPAEEEEEETKKEESMFSAHHGDALMEELQEEVEDTVSAADFAKLISSPEFRKPISDSEVATILSMNESKQVTESFFTKDCAIDGFDCAVVDEFEDAGCKGYHVGYSKNGTDIAIVEIWEDDSPIAIIENQFAPHLLNPVYDSFDAFATDLAFKCDENRLQEVYDCYDDDILTDNIDSVMHDGKFLRAHWTKNEPSVRQISQGTYEVTHYRGAGKVIVKFDLSNKRSSTMKFTVNGKPFETQYVMEAQNFILDELDYAQRKSFDIDIDEANDTKLIATGEPLTEGNLLTLGKALGKKLGQVGKNIKAKVSDAIDKFADSAKTREEKADWILDNALENYKNLRLDGNGQVERTADNKKFNTFVIIGFDGKYSNGREITQAPHYQNKDLVLSMVRPELKDKYKDADNVAKGWSMKDGNGPAFIFMAKNENDENAAFLCSYYKGEVKQDQLDTYFEAVKKDLKGIELMNDGKADQSPDSAPEAEKPADNQPEATAANNETSNEVEAEAAATTECLQRVIADVESLTEDTLARDITKSLIAEYKNVAGFKLENCEYINEQLVVNGTICYTSGATKNTAYTFTEAVVLENNEIELVGLNEKLDATKRFAATCKVDVSNRKLIVESFTIRTYR